MKGFRRFAVSTSVLMIAVTAFPAPPANAGQPSGPVVFLDDDGDVVRGVNFTISFNSSTQSLKVVVNTNINLAILANQGWVDSRISDVALENVSYSIFRWDSRPWYRVELKAGISYLDLHTFEPPADRAVYSRGSQSSIRLERAMFIRIEAKPTQRTLLSNVSNANGTWSHAVLQSTGPLVLNLTDRNTTGQEVRLGETWLSSLGIGRPSFLMSGGEDVPFEKVGGTYVLRPPHFSYIYAFAGDEHFRKETDFEYSDVYWDQGGQNVFVRSDRRDAGDEWFTRHLPQEIDSTTSFTLSATWTPTAQGHYQIAAPLFLVNSRDVGAPGLLSLQPSGLYFWYYSQNSFSAPPCATCNPMYYMFYYDRSGIARIYDLVFEGGRLVPYKFYTTYSATTRVLTTQVRSTSDAVLRSVSYTIGTNAGDDFSFGKFGAGSEDSTEHSQTDVAEGRVDDIQLTVGSVVNPSLELDSNADNVPDGWHTVYSYASRSSEVSHSGAWSIRIDDQSSSSGGGMETDDMSATPGRYYRAVAYARVQSGSFQLSIEFYDGSQIRIVYVTMTVGTTNTYWRRIYVDGVAPPGTATVRIMAWTLMGNIGLAYFDSFYLVESRLENAGFEEGLEGWGASPGTTWGVSTAHVREGLYSLRFQDNSIALPVPVIQSDPHPCVPGARYRAASWMYGESASPGDDTPFALSLIFWSASSTLYSVFTFGGAVGAWDYLAVEGVAPFDCAVMRVQFSSSWENVGIAYFDDVELLLAPPGLETENSIWTITSHVSTYDSFGVANDLGVGSQRACSSGWVYFEPSLGVYQWDLIGNRRMCIRDANQFGLDIIFIMPFGGEPPAGLTQANYDQEWFLFCLRMGTLFGASIYWWQIGNELNSGYGEIPRIEEDDVAVINRCFDALSQSEYPGDQYPYDHTWFFRTIVNAATELPVTNWPQDLRGWLNGAGASIDVIAFDPYNNYDLRPQMSVVEELAEEYKKLAAIMETGAFSEWPCSELCQMIWILDHITSQARPHAFSWNLLNHNYGWVFLGWYRQRDTPPNPETGYHDTYGLLELDGSMKLAYPIFRAETTFYVGPPFYS
ncbi:MAG TPA: hypothetical protein VJ400_07890 [Thermoplasmata archaeon]|nr:hypothetical protein [Thermoplasmata archaeon]